MNIHKYRGSSGGLVVAIALLRQLPLRRTKSRKKKDFSYAVGPAVIPSRKLRSYCGQHPEAASCD
jgi:hypothetical protein